MYFPLTTFNLITLLLMAATVGIGLARFATPPDSNWPLAYYVLVIAYWRAFAYSLDTYWVLAGVICGMLLRFEFLGGVLEKGVRAVEMVVFAYILWRCVRLILQW